MFSLGPAFYLALLYSPWIQPIQLGIVSHSRETKELLEARSLLEESEAKLSTAIVLKKICMPYEGIKSDLRIKVAENRIRVELLTILEARKQQLDLELKSPIVSKDDVQWLRKEIEKVQSLLRQMEK